MIKFILASLLLQISVGQQQNHCRSDSDCQDNECCSSAFIGRKRLIFDNGDIFHNTGTCRTLAQEGHTCEPDLSIFGGSQAHSFGCPCAAGLECHGESESHHGGSHSYTNPKCIPEGTYQGPTGSHPATTLSSGGGGYTEDPNNYRTTPTPMPQIDINQPIAELPGK